MKTKLWTFIMIMRAIPILLVLNTFFLFASAQFESNKIPAFQSPVGDLHNTVVIQMPYNDADILKIHGDTTGLRKAESIIIEIVCTDFPSYSSLFSLNQRRLQELYSLFPFLKNQKKKKIQVVRQMDGSDKKKAMTMFHGIVVHFQPIQDRETMNHDISALEKIFEYDLLAGGKITRGETYSHKDAITERTEDKYFICQISPGKVSSSLDYDSVIHIKPGEALEKELISREAYNGPVRNRNGNIIRKEGWKAEEFITIFFCNVIEKGAGTFRIDSTSIAMQLSSGKSLPDSTVLKVFKRNRWKNFALTVDVTGSMYPFTAQLLLLLKMHSPDGLTNCFTFFNDGDLKPDSEKKIGSTGGIYSKNCSSFTEVLELVLSTMHRGIGGDAPENNVEALIATEKQFPGIAFHVLIADNWAPLKDRELIPRLTMPVKVVLCGVLNNDINVDYLNLARQTGGSIHLIENDLLNLASLHEGEVLRIGNKNYRIEKGLFREIRPVEEKGL